MVLLPVAAVGAAPSASAQDAGLDCVGTELRSPDERAALVRAAECERPVEIESARAFTQRQLAEPDGTITLESYARPRFAYDREGRWVEVDPSLVADPAVGISTVATVIDIGVSPGGSGPLVTATAPAGGSLSLTWPAALLAPVLDGATATYPDVFEGVDLQVTAGADSFSYGLVVHSAQAAANPELARIDVTVTGDGLDLSQAAEGAVLARNPAGAVVFSAAGAAMWDSSAPPPATDPETLRLPGGDLPGLDPGRVEEIELGLAGNRLQVTPDQAMLTDPQTEFPVTIDPSFSASKLAWTVLGNGQYADSTWWNDGAWPRNEGLRIGFQGWTEPGSEGYGRWRSMARFNTAAVRGSTINSASVRLTLFHTGGCDSYPLQLWQVKAITQGAVPTSWNSTSSNWLHGGPLDTRTVPSANSTGEWCAVMPERDVMFTSDGIRHQVQRHADSALQSITFGLRSGNEGDKLQWMRAYPESFLLVVNYTPVTAVPGGLSTDGVGCLAPVGSRVAGSAPVLSGAPRHSEGTAAAQVEVRAAGGAEVVRSWESGAVPSGEPVSWQVDPPLADAAYEWRMRSENPATGSVSDWSGWCGFVADSTVVGEPDPEASTVECPVPVEPGEVLEAADESVALLLAQACDAQVEVTSLRDFDARVLAQPDGTLQAEQYTQPQWALDGDGEWTGVDTSFQVAPDGSIATTAAVSEIEVSTGGDDPLLTATDPEGGSVSLWWP